MKSNKKLAQSLVEYGLILALVAVIAIGALQLLGQKVNQAAEKSGSQIDAGVKDAAQSYCESLGTDKYEWTTTDATTGAGTCRYKGD